MTTPAAYFESLDARRFQPTQHVQGAWSLEEQHIAPALGLIAHAIERDRDERGAHDKQLGRVSYDIFGTVPIEPVAIVVEVLRGGRTVELVQARLTHGDRTIVLARAWLMTGGDTAGVAGSPLPSIPGPEQTPPYDPTSDWAGGFISSVKARRRQVEPGRAVAWVRTPVALLAGEEVSATASTLRLVDIANGLTPRESPEEVVFPNVELTIHLLRAPRAGWLGLDTSVAFGPTGLGLTHTVLHDETGPFAVSTQTLTVRPLPRAADPR